MLDVVGHHRGGAAQHIDAKIAIGESREGLMRGCGRGRRRGYLGSMGSWREICAGCCNCSGLEVSAQAVQSTSAARELNCGI